MSLVRVFPTARVYVPTVANLDENHPLVQVLGIPLAIRLCECMGGQYILFPSIATVDNVLRDKYILLLWRNGRPTARLAREHGVSERRIRMIIEKELARES